LVTLPRAERSRPPFRFAKQRANAPLIAHQNGADAEIALAPATLCGSVDDEYRRRAGRHPISRTPESSQASAVDAFLERSSIGREDADRIDLSGEPEERAGRCRWTATERHCDLGFAL
jgi:hypothetical protein